MREEQHRFEQVVRGLPISWERLMSLSLDYLFYRLEPNDVTMKRHPNGVTIEIKMDEDGIEELTEFWETNVAGGLE